MSRRTTKLYVGNLPMDVRKEELEDMFRKFGPIHEIDRKYPDRKPAFAFVEYEDARDAEDAVHELDGTRFDGEKLRVEFSHSKAGGGRDSRDSRDSFRDRGGRGAGRGGPPRRSEYRLMVSGLPRSGSWQDLKDHMKKAGPVCFSDVTRDGNGVVEFERYDGLKRALDTMDNTEFVSHENERSTIYVKEDRGGRRSRSRSRSRSPRRRHSRSRSRSPRRSRSRSPARRRSRSRSASRSRSRSPQRRSRSKSRSPSPRKEKSRSRSRSRSPSPRKDRSRSRSVSPGANREPIENGN